MNCLLAFISYILTLKHVSDDILYLLDRSILGKSCIKNIDIISYFSVKFFAGLKLNIKPSFWKELRTLKSGKLH